MARKYTHMVMYEREMIEMINAGSTLREVGEKYGFTFTEMREFKKRYNRKKRMQEAGIEPLKRGRPRKDCVYTDDTKVEHYKRQLRLAEYENKRLKMENELLRDFLSLTEGK